MAGPPMTLLPAFAPFDGPPADDAGMGFLVVALAVLLVVAVVLLFGPERR